MYEVNVSLETIVGNIAMLFKNKPGNKLLVSRNKVAPTDHPLIALVEGIDYTDQYVLDIFQESYLEHVQLERVIHGFKNIDPNSRYKDQIIWCVGTTSASVIATVNDVVSGMPDVARQGMGIDLVSCTDLVSWHSMVKILKSDDGRLSIGCVGKPNTVYQMGVNMHRMLSLASNETPKVPLALCDADPSERLWFVYKDTQPNTRIMEELQSYRVVHL